VSQNVVGFPTTFLTLVLVNQLVAPHARPAVLCRAAELRRLQKPASDRLDGAVDQTVAQRRLGQGGGRAPVTRLIPKLQLR
jgi:hypothetical protein